jgi:hypothetical protein
MSALHALLPTLALLTIALGESRGGEKPFAALVVAE